MAYNNSNGVSGLKKDVQRLTNRLENETVKVSGDQTIDGTKEFSKNVVANAFYDSSLGSRILPPAILSISNDEKGRLLVSNGDSTVSGDGGLVYEDGCLSANSIMGSGAGITDLQANAIVGNISTSNLSLGPGIDGTNDTISVKIGNGFVFENNEINLNIPRKAGLYNNEDTGLRIDPTNATIKNSLSNNDRFLISDSDNSDSLKAATVKGLTRYMQNVLKFTTPAGSSSEIQFNNRGTFSSTSGLRFSNNTNTLHMPNTNISGELKVGRTKIDEENIIFGLPNTSVNNSELSNSSCQLYLDEKTNKLMVKVKFSNGTVKTGSIDLL